MAGDGDRFEIESVRYIVWELNRTGPEKLRSVPTHIADFIADWLVADLAKGAQSSVRQAYTDALIDRDEDREDDRADWSRQFYAMAG